MKSLKCRSRSSITIRQDVGKIDSVMKVDNASWYAGVGTDVVDYGQHRSRQGACFCRSTGPFADGDHCDYGIDELLAMCGGYRAIVRGYPAERRFSVIYLKRGAVVALDCMNMVREYVHGRKLVEARTIVDPSLIANPRRP